MRTTIKLDQEITEKLSVIFGKLKIEILVLFHSITDKEQLDTTARWLKIHYPAQTPTAYDIICLKRGIQKWGDVLEDQFSKDFKDRFPLVTEKMDTPGKKLIFLRMTDFLLHVKPEILAKIVEPIIETCEERKQVVTSNPKLEAIAMSPQPDIQAFRHVFFHPVQGRKDEQINIRWRKEEECE